MTYNKYISKTASEKITLAHIHGVKRIYNFIPDNGLYSRAVPHFVTGVRNGTTKQDLEVATSLEGVNSSSFYYDSTTSKLYLSNYNHENDEIIVNYRFFYSNSPINLSWDLNDNSFEVEYESRIDSAPSFKSQMSQGKKGINLIGSGTLSLINTDKGLNGIYDSLIWDNKEVKIYSYNRALNPSEAKLIFRGIISGKSFTSTNINFNVKDSIYSLEAKVPLTEYGSLTRESDSLFYKRQIFGRVENLLVQSIDQVGNGYPLTGTLSGKYDENIVNGFETSFLSEVSPNDTLIFPTFTVKVEDVLSNTQLRTSALEGSFSNLEALIEPEIHFSNKNRTFQVASHAVKKWSCTITEIISRNRLIVDSADGFEAGDIISLNGESKTIRRVSGNTIVLQTNFNLVHSIGEIITKTEITNVRYGSKQTLISNKNITINNSKNGATISLSPSSEYDASPERTLNHSFRFVSGRSKVWIGSPTFIDITCVPSNRTGNSPTSYSLMGKWFSIKDEEGNSVGFWFKDQIEERNTTVPKPAQITTIQGTDGGKVKSINLESRSYTANEIAHIVAGAVSSSISAWSFSLSNNVVKLESKDTININIGDMGTTGFTQNKTLSGIPAVSQIDLTKFIRTRDFIKSVDQDVTSYLEVLSVDEKSLTLRSPYTGTTRLSNMNYKNVDYIQDDSPVYVNCFGKTQEGTPEGKFIETAPDAVMDILKQVGLEERIDLDSFNKSIERSPYLLSLVIPLDFRSRTLPSAKEIINTLNQSTLGSLHITNSLDIGYDILDGHTTDEDLLTIDDSDVISWSVSDDSFDLSATVITKYRHMDYDPKLNSTNSKQYSFNSSFVENYSQSTNTSENNIHLYKDDDAKEMTEREQFVNDLSTSIIKIKGNISLSKVHLGERIILNLRGLYNSFGSKDNSLRIGIVSAINNNGVFVDIEVLDLGSLFIRGARITSDDSPNYKDSTPTLRTSNSFIVNDNGIIGDDEDTAGTGLIS